MDGRVYRRNLRARALHAAPAAAPRISERRPSASTRQCGSPAQYWRHGPKQGDAFGRDLRAEVVGEIDGRLHKQGGGIAVRHVLHEHLVDLLLLRRNGAEIGQGGEARAVVFDRRVDACAAQLGHEVERQFRIVDDQVEQVHEDRRLSEVFRANDPREAERELFAKAPYIQPANPAHAKQRFALYPPLCGEKRTPLRQHPVASR